MLLSRSPDTPTFVTTEMAKKHSDHREAYRIHTVYMLFLLYKQSVMSI